MSGQYFEAVALSRSWGGCCSPPTMPIPEPQAVPCFPGQRGRVYLPRIPTSWERRSASTSSPTPSSALPRKASTGRKNSCSPTSSFPWPTRRRSKESTGSTNATSEFWAIVRLKDGVTPAQAQADLNTIAARMRNSIPRMTRRIGFKLIRPGLFGDFFGAPARGFLAGVMGLAGIVLLAACANLGSLFAARTADRTREIAIRMAIGSSRWRVVRQVLVEAFVISIRGGVRLRVSLDRTHRPGGLASTHRFPHPVRCTAAALVDPDRDCLSRCWPACCSG